MAAQRPAYARLTLRNRLTHDYDLEAESALELVALIRSSAEVLSGIIRRFEASCREAGLLPPSP